MAAVGFSFPTRDARSSPIFLRSVLGSICYPHYLYLQIILIIFLTINPIPPGQLSPWVVWEETGECGENPRLTTFGRVSMNSSHVRSDVRYRAGTHDLGGWRTSLRRLSHRRPHFISRLPDLFQFYLNKKKHTNIIFPI